jgi:hypothetical protein
MDDELEGVLKEALLVYPRHYPTNCLKGLRIPRRTSVSIARIQGEIGTKYLSNTSISAAATPTCSVAL